MRVIYRDDLGLVAVKVDDSGVQLNDGKCYFTDTNGEDYAIDIENVDGMDEGE